MPRPSLKAERREQILCAAEECIAKFGIAGLTLEKVAEFADLARPLVRHNVGNRDQIISAVVERYVAHSREMMDSIVASVPAREPLKWIVDVLFDLKYSDPQLVLVAEALIAEGANDPELANTMNDWLSRFVNEIENIAKSQFPKASKHQLTAVASGITGIYFTVDSMSPIGEMKPFRKASKDAALMLLDALSGQK